MINMVQKFEFETDSLEDFEQMLQTIVHLEFRHKNSEYVKLHLKSKPESFWDDGRDYKWTNNCILQIGQANYSLMPCATYHGAKQFKICNQHVSLEEAAKEANHCERLTPTRLWVATLCSSAYAFQEKDKYCRTQSHMVMLASEAMEKASKNKKAFDELRVPEWMENGDGSIGMGYRIASEWDTGARVLQLSLCHVYYGK